MSTESFVTLPIVAYHLYTTRCFSYAANHDVQCRFTVVSKGGDLVPFSLHTDIILAVT
jgi:hypothetical protein